MLLVIRRLSRISSIPILDEIDRISNQAVNFFFMPARLKIFFLRDIMDILFFCWNRTRCDRRSCSACIRVVEDERSQSIMDFLLVLCTVHGTGALPPYKVNDVARTRVVGSFSMEPPGWM